MKNGSKKKIHESLHNEIQAATSQLISIQVTDLFRTVSRKHDTVTASVAPFCDLPFRPDTPTLVTADAEGEIVILSQDGALHRLEAE